jgi:hypothetical protein
MGLLSNILPLFNKPLYASPPTSTNRDHKLEPEDKTNDRTKTTLIFQQRPYQFLSGRYTMYLILRVSVTQELTNAAKESGKSITNKYFKAISDIVEMSSLNNAHTADRLAVYVTLMSILTPV